MNKSYDPVLVEVMKNRFQAIVDEMGMVILKTGHTVFVKETADFGASLVSPGGEVFAVPNKIGVASMVGRPMWDAIQFTPNLQEGDIIIANDPETTKGLSTHLNDLFIWKPVFYDDQIVCFGLTFLHASDVGGRVPGSISPSSTEIFQEGLILPPTHLAKRGDLDQEVINLIRANSRIPDQNWGDLKALLAAVNVAEERIHALIQKQGLKAFSDGVDGVLDYAETQVRTLIDEIPDGEYRFTDFLEGPVIVDEPIQISLNLQVKGTEITMDFSGTDSEVLSAFNLPSHSQNGHWCLVRGLVDFFRTMIKDITHNSGLVRPVKIVAPEGSLLNPHKTAACGVRAATILRVYDCTMAALAQAVQDKIPACGSGQASILLVSVPELRGGGMRVSVVQPLTGGSGGRPFKDGVDGADTASGYLRNVPTESIENELPIIIRDYAIHYNSGGAGKFRGGCGIVLEFEVLAPKALVTSRGLERYMFEPWGIFGGHTGSRGYSILNPGREDERNIGRFDLLELEKGDVLRMATPGGGGYGFPFERDVGKVLEDVGKGFVSKEWANRDYGIVFDKGEVNLEKTKEKRKELELRTDQDMMFSLGVTRHEFDKQWPEETRQAIHEILGQYSGMVRELVKKYLQEKIYVLREQNGTVTAEDIKREAEIIIAKLIA